MHDPLRLPIRCAASVFTSRAVVMIGFIRLQALLMLRSLTLPFLLRTRIPHKTSKPDVPFAPCAARSARCLSIATLDALTTAHALGAGSQPSAAMQSTMAAPASRSACTVVQRITSADRWWRRPFTASGLADKYLLQQHLQTIQNRERLW